MNNRQEWNRREYALVVRALKSPGNAGVLLSGEFGTGKSQLVRRLVTSKELHLPMIRLICSAALTDSSYGALAPLLSGAQQPINDVSAIRAALAAVEELLQLEHGAEHVLITIEEAQSIDSASAFVLGQMVRSGKVKLLVVSNEQHEDPLSLDALMSVARLTRVVVEPLTPDEIVDFSGTVLGYPVSRGSAKIIHQLTSGFQSLVQDYLELAVRLGILLEVEQLGALRESSLAIDHGTAGRIAALAHRHPPQVQQLFEILCITGPLSIEQVDRLGLREALQQHPTALIELRDGWTYLSSEFFEEGLRASMPAGRSAGVYREVLAHLGEDLPVGPDFVGFRLIFGDTVSREELLAAARGAQRSHRYQQALELLEKVEEPDREAEAIRLLAHLGAGQFQAARTLLSTSSGKLGDEEGSLAQDVGCALNWLHPAVTEPGGDLTQRFWGTSASDGGHSDGYRGGDCALVEGIERVRSLYWLGQPSTALHLSEQSTVGGTAVPSCRYRLALLVVAVRSAVATGSYEQASRLVDGFVMGSSYELLMEHGTVQALRALIDARRGQVSNAQLYLRQARAELALNDPEGLLALCSSLDLLIEQSSNGEALSEDGAQRNDKAEQFGQCNAGRREPGALAANAWWAADQLECDLLAELQRTKPSAGVIDRILRSAQQNGVFLYGILTYQVWNLSRNEQLASRAAEILGGLEVPEECAALQRRQRAVQVVQDSDVKAMQGFAQELHDEGDRVLALEMITRVVDYWSAQDNPRNRGFAIRQIHEWLHQMGQKPWGRMARSLEESGLTARENEIVELVRQGLSNREIARLLTVSQRTVEGHLYRIFAKLGITQRSDLNFGGRH
ncbi:LuxR C-terminal-related transcriptional regulator [Glutamicibacter sp. BSL13]